MKTRTIELGTLIHGTMRNEDLVPVFVRELVSRRVWSLKISAEWSLAYINATEKYQNELVAELFDALNEELPDGIYFGAHVGDGSDYGYWYDEDWVNEHEIDEDGKLHNVEVLPVSGPWTTDEDTGKAKISYPQLSSLIKVIERFKLEGKGQGHKYFSDLFAPSLDVNMNDGVYIMVWPSGTVGEGIMLGIERDGYCHS